MSRLPTTVPELSCFTNIGKKSAVLVLQSVYAKPFGIAVDRHLVFSFHRLDWCYHLAKSPGHATKISFMVELWMDHAAAMKVNNLLAGLRMLLRDSSLRQRCRAVAQELGARHLADLDKLWSPALGS